MSDDGDSVQATKDALARIAEGGSDMARPMQIDFFIDVPDRSSGIAVADEVVQLGYSTKVEADDGDWTVYCTREMVPNLEAVLATERQLEEVAKRHGGHADGFGSFGNASDDQTGATDV